MSAYRFHLFASALIGALVFAAAPANAEGAQTTSNTHHYGPSKNNYKAGGSSYGPSHDSYNGKQTYSPGSDYSNHSHNDYGSSKQALDTSVPY